MGLSTACKQLFSVGKDVQKKNRMSDEAFE